VPPPGVWADAGSSAARPDATRLRLVYSLVGERTGLRASGAAAKAFANARNELAWRLSTVEMFHERRLSGPPHTDVAAATAARLDGFSAGERASEPDFTTGYWEASAGAALNLLPAERRAGKSADDVRRAARPSRVLPVPFWAMEPKPQWSVAARAGLGQPCTLLLLPLGCWAFVEQPNPGLLVVESGRLLSPGQHAAGERQVVASSWTAGELDSVTIGRDAPLTLAEAAAKGHLQSDDPQEQAFFDELLAQMDMDSDLTTAQQMTSDATLYADTGDDEVADYDGDYEDEEEREVRAPRPTRGI